MWQGPWHCFPLCALLSGQLAGLRGRAAPAATECLSKSQVQPARLPHPSVQCVQAELLAEEAAERNKAEAKAADKAAKKQAKAAKGESDRSGMCS